AALLGPIANEKHIDFDCRVAADVPRLLAGDPGRIRQVLMNLVANALKFTVEGSVRVKIERRDQREGEVELELSVLDTGIGIAPDAVARLFQPYEQADAGIAGRFGGTGLGLSISQKLVRAMGGEMGVESTLGEGSRFWARITLPLASGPAIAAPPPLSSTPQGAVMM